MSKIKRNKIKQHKAKAVRIPTIIFTLFGSYIIHREGEIWVGSLIKLLKPFILSEIAIRLALSRMSGRDCFKVARRDEGAIILSPKMGTSGCWEANIGHWIEIINHGIKNGGFSFIIYPKNCVTCGML